MTSSAGPTGAGPSSTPQAWTSTTRTPAGYPDAVTLLPDPDVGALLARFDGSAGCSIKDSFASLDLSAEGFRVLFEAEWIVHTGPSPAGPAVEVAWEAVRDRAGLAAWEKGWRGKDGPTGVFKTALLDEETVVLAWQRQREVFVAGAVLHRSGDVVGVSNVFGDQRSAWGGCLSFAASRFPGTPLVGYELGDDLAEARRHGFEPAGPLRVWIRDA